MREGEKSTLKAARAVGKLVPRIHCGVGGIEPLGDWKAGLRSETATASLIKSAFAKVTFAGCEVCAHHRLWQETVGLSLPHPSVFYTEMETLPVLYSV